MILLSVGTVCYPFTRLAQAVKTVLCSGNEDVVIQYGFTPAFIDYSMDSHHLVNKSIMTDAELSMYMRRSRITIIQAGEGSFIRALESCSSPPIIVPRSPHYGEHVDDQQMKLAALLERESRALVAMDPKRIPDLIRNYAHVSGRVVWERRKHIVNRSVIRLLNELV